MKPFATFLITLALSVFGVVTVFLASSVIFDLFNVRSHEGNYVLFVVWANLFSGLLFLAAAVGFVTKKGWTTFPLAISAVLLMLAFIGLLIHVNADGLYESKTVGAMIFRIVINLILLTVIHFTFRPRVVGDLIQRGLFISLPVLLVLSACSPSADKKASHEQTHAKDHHEHNEGTSPAIELDNGEKWKADENTLRLVHKMEGEVSAFRKSPESDYKSLSDSLRKDLDLLVAGCTMKGKAHEELHKWLLPNIDQVKLLSTAQTKDEAHDIVKKLEESYSVFNQSFE